MRRPYLRSKLEYSVKSTQFDQTKDTVVVVEVHVQSECLHRKV